MAIPVKRILKIILLLIAAAFIAIQFWRPDRTNPPVDPKQSIEAFQQVPPQVAAVLQRSCDDCHSNKTVWPFYSQIAPVSWLVADDVRIGRGHLNFSQWGSYDKRRQSKKLQQICDEITDGAMPLSQYLIVHRGAKLTPDEVKLLCGWTEVEQQRIEDEEPAK